MCGLKLRAHQGTPQAVYVTPCMGVWIETESGLYYYDATVVTPCMGVWIETNQRACPCVANVVTPCMGVWIETDDKLYIGMVNMSHPVWVCGLKHNNDNLS